MDVTDQTNQTDEIDREAGAAICAARVKSYGFSKGHAWQVVWSPLEGENGAPMLVCTRCGENGWVLT